MEDRDAYICYNNADIDWVTRFAEQLESETIDGLPSSRRLQVFFDRWDMEPGSSVVDRMNEGMARSRHVITILTPEFLAADWPRFEWKHIVADDPNNTKGRLVPCLLRDVSLNGTDRITYPAPFRDLKYVDFRRQTDFKRSFNQVVGKIRNLPIERGKRLRAMAPAVATVFPSNASPEASWLPDSVSEFLFSNLFPVSDLPLYIWHAATPYSEKEKLKIWEAVPNCPAFILRGGRLYTFARLEASEERLRDVVNISSIGRDSRLEWALKVDRQNWLMALLNSSLNNHLRRKHIRTDGKGRFYFIPHESGKNRSWPMPVGKPRTVAKRIVDETKGTSFWVHQGAEVRFRRIEEKIFLAVVPLYLFTEDGFATIGGKAAGKLSQMWMGKQQNPDIFRDVLFWAYVMSGGWRVINIETGDEPIRIDSTPASSRAQHGALFDTVNIRTLLQHKESELDDIAAQISNLEEADETAED
jgi:hypothetical protein